jgi:hypothetical protein
MSEPFLALSREQIAAIVREADGTPDGVLVALVHVLRQEEPGGGNARKRARRMGAISGLAGMLGQLPAEALQLVEETRAAIDIAAVRAPQRGDEQIAADLLVLWGLVDELATAERITTTREPSLLGYLTEKYSEQVREAVPEKWTPVATLKFLWKMRELRNVKDVIPGGIVRNIPVVGALPTALHAGRDMKAFQKELEQHYAGST